MELEPGLVRQVSALVDRWDAEVLDAITGHLTSGEADLLARVFAADRGLEAGLLVMVSFMGQTILDGERADWAGDAQQVRELGWLTGTTEEWDRTALIWSDPMLHSTVVGLAEYGDRLDDETAASSR